MGLSAIAHKPAIVSTFAADVLAADADRVQDAYDWHYATYVEQPPIAAWRSAFLNAIRDRRTPKACLVAPFGYGKTATAIGVWHACADAQILAVPPVACGSLAEIAYAVCDWLLFRLPDQRTAVLAARERFLIASADVLARRDEREFGIPFDQALAAIRDKLERGYLDFEDVSINLLALLETATELAVQSGYGGFVVILDEGQQLVGNAGKGILVALRQLVWGLRTRDLPLGLLLTLDPDTERTLADRAGDILHRVKDDGLYLDIRDVYGRDFPAGLWQQYTATFGLKAAERNAIDRPTLEALGQLCEREDLSNGPRTVVDVLQHAAARPARGFGPGYSPVDLVSDLVEGTLRFAGDRNTLPALVAEFLNYPYFQRDVRLADALKLIAAFPRGCPAEVADRYGLSDAVATLNTALRGEVLTELDEGLALIELQRVARPANRLNQLLRRYWMQITDEELFAEDAAQVFATTFVPLLFSTKQHDLSGWHVVEEIRLAADGTYRAVFEGTASPDFPLRRIGIRVMDADAGGTPPSTPEDLDFWFVFHVSARSRGEPNLVVEAPEGAVAWHVPLLRPDAVGLDGGLRWIEHYLNPHPISAATVLSLLRYLEREGSGGSDERDRTRIEDTISRLQGWLLSRVLAEPLFAAAGWPVAQAGAGALAEFLYALCRARWPAYQPLATHRHWAALLGDYQHALSTLAPPLRTGLAPLAASKAEIAAAFRQERHAGFESRARQYEPILKLQAWRADQAVVCFVPLAAELEVAQAVRAAGGLRQGEAYSLLRRAGFAAAESDAILALGAARGLYDLQDGNLVPLAVIPLAEMRARAQQLAARASDIGRELAAEIRELEEVLAAENHDETSVWRLDRIEAAVAAVETRRVAERERERQGARADLLRELARLRALTAPPSRSALSAALAAVHSRIESLRIEIARRVDAVANGDSAAQMVRLRSEVERYTGLADAYERWCGFTLRVETLTASEPGAYDPAGPASDLLSRARTILAVDGFSAIGEIAVLEVHLAEVERVAAAARPRPHVADPESFHSVVEQLCGLFGLNQAPRLQVADLAECERELTALMRRGLAYLAARARVARCGAKTKRAILADIEAARQDTGPGLMRWLDDDGVRPEVAQRISRIRERIAETRNGVQSDLLPERLIEGPVDISPLARQDDGDTVDRLRRVLELVSAGVLRLSVEVPQPSSDTPSL